MYSILSENPPARWDGLKADFFLGLRKSSTKGFRGHRGGGGDVGHVLD